VDVAVPECFVPIAYLTDPDTEYLVWGDELQEGMVVVVDGAILSRENPDNIERDGYSRARVLESARWCRVTKLRRRGELVSFIGVYGDGSQAARTYNIQFAWIVKRSAS
jgi:hypothetical protein